MGDFARMALASAVLLAFIQCAAARWSRRASRWAVADVVWGPGLAAVALLGLLTGHGGIARGFVLAVLVCAWGARLGFHVWRRLRAHDEDDPRYVRMADGRSTATMMLRVFGIQAVTQWIVSLPLQVAAVSADPHGITWPLTILGAVVTAGGLVFEAVADRQLEQYKQLDPRPRIMDRGLWGWSRHPNYFGDACVWIGVYVIACSTWPGPLTFASPVLMTGLLVWGSGARLTERAMDGRPGVDEYRSRTSMFVPWPPRTR
ncbi:MAG TPA: DUF1295 domain-containing protein [Flexivirga sp.]|uniref:DUF1295 domain-containing protein n=1 Tax=Flexivirga sp. TaxID=1962927 RepID=UPI002BA1E699|nr:DUF1295 domain-containing protein [Flexivirga sp.]HWC21509.1 DUF1295 domain-containing protein [Flexivirga sp.]